MSRPRVLITGAAGFVGRSLVAGFAELGWSVTALDQAFDEGPPGDRVDQITADLALGVPVGTPRADAVVHGAWFTGDPVSPGMPTAEYLALNLRPLLATLEFAAATGADDFVFLSSSGVFGPDDGSDGLTDVDRPTGTSPYSVSKRVCETVVAGALDPGSGTAGHVVRLGYLYGPGEAPRPTRPGISMVARWLMAARQGRPLEVRADGPPRDWTFAPDLAPAIERLLREAPAEGPVHLASPFVLRDRALAELIASQLPGTKVVTVAGEPDARPLSKPPMVSSDVPACRDFPWTGPMEGLHAVLGREVDAHDARRSRSASGQATA